MNNGCISLDRLLGRLDSLLDKNDYVGAEKHLLYWRDEAEASSNYSVELTVLNELMGLYRKLGKEKEALECVGAALELIEKQGIGHQVGAATAFLNCATVYKAFGRAAESISLFEKAKAIYEKELSSNDSRLGGLYNNMGLALVDLGRFGEADAMYRSAISVMEKAESGDLEVAITYLNMASAAEAELGLLDADEKICDLLDRAEALLEGHGDRNGYYAFVCEKCASVFDYYGRFVYAKELYERSKRIYGNERS